MPGAGEGT